MTMAATRILVVDDDAQEAAGIERALSAAGYDVHRVAGCLDGLVAVEDEGPALVVLDGAMSPIDGAMFLHALHAGLSHPPAVLVLTDGGADPSSLRNAGASAVLSAPPDTGDLVRVVTALLGDGRSSLGR